MLLFARKQVAQPAPTPPPPKTAEVIAFPTAKPIIDTAGDIGYYEDVAAKLGFAPSQMLREQLRNFLASENIPVFSFTAVDKWLTPKVKAAKLEHWCWRPLRPDDSIKKYMWGFKDNKISQNGFYRNSLWECRPYARLVPERVLQRTLKIHSEFGDKVCFFVTDYATPDADPFIMVRPRSCDDADGNYQFIFDVWDEPGFKG